MPTIDRGLLERTRTESKKMHIDLSKGVQKTGKEKVRETFYKNAQATVNKRGQMLQNFLSEQGKGGLTSIVA